ncbi:MAG: AAA family ATPase [SAR324 cluster bacterium]|nr:AAA family ATPase [SAR324 cluster bacterium]
MFKDVIGLSGLKQILKSFLKTNNHLSNFIFIGARGCGKSTMALSFAKSIFCFNHSGGGESCGSCESCLMFERGQHPDFILVKPTSATIKISQIQTLQNKILSAPALSSKRVVFIKNADKLGLEAANAFLKTFEEAHHRCFIILSISTQKNLLPTLLSRGVKIYFPILTDHQISDILKIKFNWEQSQINQYQFIFKQGIRKDWIENWDEFSALRDEVIKILLDLPKSDFSKVLFAITNWANKNQTLLVIEILMSWFRDVIVINHSQKGYLINQDYLLPLKESFWCKIDFLNIYDLLLMLRQSERAIHFQANKNLSLISTFIRLKELS